MGVWVTQALSVEAIPSNVPKLCPACLKKILTHKLEYSNI